MDYPDVSGAKELVERLFGPVAGVGADVDVAIRRRHVANTVLCRELPMEVARRIAEYEQMLRRAVKEEEEKGGGGGTSTTAPPAGDVTARPKISDAAQLQDGLVELSAVLAQLEGWAEHAATAGEGAAQVAMDDMVRALGKVFDEAGIFVLVPTRPELSKACKEASRVIAKVEALRLERVKKNVEEGGEETGAGKKKGVKKDKAPAKAKEDFCKSFWSAYEARLLSLAKVLQVDDLEHFTSRKYDISKIQSEELVELSRPPLKLLCAILKTRHGGATKESIAPVNNPMLAELFRAQLTNIEPVKRLRDFMHLMLHGKPEHLVRIFQSATSLCVCAVHAAALVSVGLRILSLRSSAQLRDVFFYFVFSF